MRVDDDESEDDDETDDDDDDRSQCQYFCDHSLWDRLVRLVGPSEGPFLGRCWKHLGLSWGCIEALLARSWRVSWGLLGSFGGPLWAMLEGID